MKKKREIINYSFYTFSLIIIDFPKLKKGETRSQNSTLKQKFHVIVIKEDNLHYFSPREIHS
ncbi:uncharacterized protein BX663DRAFT_493676 [Cokeromyces recurvatus]|uniref:uncharacterized protein n=1 Tax=Cokeromyces recurvatus TaxID=90255 RepID=UPI00221F936B|nr:uncharacterized protein BX663DRAFT_493676 [Cokeromyces recurvatus]KAI7908288.1 hypothetical protein BX663DRAFT_493676 [Cokeromyces recurvatus]